MSAAHPLKLLTLLLSAADVRCSGAFDASGAWWPPASPPKFPPSIPPPFSPPTLPPAPGGPPTGPPPPPPPMCDVLCSRTFGGVLGDYACYKLEGGVGTCRPKHDVPCPDDMVTCFRSYSFWQGTQPTSPSPPPSPAPPSAPSVPPGVTAPPPAGCNDRANSCSSKAANGKCWKRKVQKKCSCSCPGR